jgi:hypothetical protein
MKLLGDMFKGFVNPVALLFNGWIPPAGQVEHMGSRSQR